MPQRCRRPKRRLLFFLACSVMLAGLWAASHVRPWGASWFSRDGMFYNVTFADGAVRGQAGHYPRVDPSFAQVEGSVAWHGVAPHPDFGERAVQSFCGVTSGEFTAPLRHRALDKVGVHWSEVQFVRVPFWLIGGVFAVGVGILLLPGGRPIPEATAARFG